MSIRNLTVDDFIKKPSLRGEKCWAFAQEIRIGGVDFVIVDVVKVEPGNYVYPISNIEFYGAILFSHELKIHAGWKRINKVFTYFNEHIVDAENGIFSAHINIDHIENMITSQAKTKVKKLSNFESLELEAAQSLLLNLQELEFEEADVRTISQVGMSIVDIISQSHQFAEITSDDTQETWLAIRSYAHKLIEEIKLSLDDKTSECGTNERIFAMKFFTKMSKMAREEHMRSDSDLDDNFSISEFETILNM